MNKTVVDEVIVEEEIANELLKVADRCTRCGARAYVKAIKDDFELLFCGHHGNEHAAKLQIDGWIVIDQTYRITEED